MKIALFGTGFGLRQAVRYRPGGRLRPEPAEASEDQRPVRVRHHHRPGRRDHRPISGPGRHLPPHQNIGAVRLTEAKGRRRPRLGLVDLDTGEINIP
jgi:hypothetical protein